MSETYRAIVGSAQSVSDGALLLVPDKNLLTGIADVRTSLGSLTSLEEDLLTVAAAIYAVDLAAKRGERESYIRDLHLVVPVVNYHAFQRVAEDLAYILYLLSDDNWVVDFATKEGTAESAHDWPTKKGKTLLFSGGLDSLAGAVDALESNEVLQLASHYTNNPVIHSSQNNLFTYLNDHFKGRLSRVEARITGRRQGNLDFPADDDREASQRTRSFMFLVVGAIAARRAGFHEVVLIAENGQMAIHLPITAARFGAFSTHTAHPSVIAGIEDLLQTLLSFPILIRNPYLYQTKAETIRSLVKQHQIIIPESVSCWRSSRQMEKHCGECVPCLIRRIALEHHGLRISGYARDLLVEDVANLRDDDNGKRNLVELLEFARYFRQGSSEGQIEDRFPDLVNEHVDKERAIDMYRRFSVEADSVFSNYPTILRVSG